MTTTRKPAPTMTPEELAEWVKDPVASFRYELKPKPECSRCGKEITSRAKTGKCSRCLNHDRAREFKKQANEPSKRQRAAWAVSKQRLSVGKPAKPSDCPAGGAHHFLLEPQSTAANGVCTKCGYERWFNGGDGDASMFTQPTLHKPKPDELPVEGVNTW